MKCPAGDKIVKQSEDYLSTLETTPKLQWRPEERSVGYTPLGAMPMNLGTQSAAKAADEAPWCTRLSEKVFKNPHSPLQIALFRSLMLSLKLTLNIYIVPNQVYL